MIRPLFLAAVFLVFLAPLSPAESIFPYKFHETTLPNGLHVILIPMKNEGLASFFTVVRVGSRDEVEPGKTGFAHFFEHMMFRGTKKYPAEKYGEIIGNIGADRNAFTSDDVTGYYMHFPSQFLETVIDLESDRFRNLKYELPAFQTEAKAVLGEYNKNFANPFFQLEDKMNSTAFTKSTYSHTTMGYLKDIQDMPNQYDYSQQFFDRFYRPDNCTIIVTGSIDPQQTLTLIKKYYSDWKKGKHKNVIPQEPEQTEERRAKVDYQGDTLPILAMGYKAPAFHPASKDYAGLSILAELVLGATSPLYRKLVLEEQKVDFVGADNTPHVDPYLFLIYARLKKAEDLAVVEESITAALEEAKNKPVDAKKLADLKANLKYSFLMSFDTSKSVVNGLYSSLPPYSALIRGVAAVDQLFHSYQSITPEDVQQIAKKYFQKQKRTIVTLTGAK